MLTPAQSRFAIGAAQCGPPQLFNYCVCFLSSLRLRVCRVPTLSTPSPAFKTIANSPSRPHAELS